MKQGPCYNCEERASGCHSSCEKYISFKVEREAENAQRNKERRGYQELCEYRQKKWKRLK